MLKFGYNSLELTNYLKFGYTKILIEGAHRIFKLKEFVEYVIIYQ